MVGRFSRRVHAWAKKQGIPLIHCAAGERKHERAEQYLPQDPDHHGLFLILVAKAPGLVWQVTHSNNGVHHLQRKTPWPYVNHYHFHVTEPDLGAPHYQAEWPSPLSAPGYAQRSRMGRAPGPKADYLRE